MKIRVGLVGLGAAWESRHRMALRALSDRFEVRAVCEQISLRAEQAARDFGADVVDGFRALTRRADVDAILMFASQWYGCLPILAACDEGKAVYSAISMEMDPRRARYVHDRVEDAGIAFMSEFPRRHSPATIRLKELIATRLGAPRLLFCHMRRPAEDGPAGPRGAARGTPTNDLIELVDWCCYVVGKNPTSVIGIRHGDSGAIVDDDYQMMSLDFSDGASPGSGPTAQISCGRYMPATWQEAVAFRPPAALQVACERGIAFVDLPSTLVWFDGAGRHQESLENDRPVGEQLLGLFHRAVTSLVRDTAGLQESFRALSVVLDARRSHSEGRRIFFGPRRSS